MKKIISLFKRDYSETQQVYDEVVSGAEWVLNGEGVPTVKVDGTCCMVRDGKLYKRYDAKNGKNPPYNFEPAQEPDTKTGHWPGWVPVGDSPEDKWHRESLDFGPYKDGTYELIGPKIQGNRYNLIKHRLVKHGSLKLNITPDYVPRDFEGIRKFLANHPEMEGIVWHHEDGRMVKIKRRDFGFVW